MLETRYWILDKIYNKKWMGASKDFVNDLIS